MSLETEPSVLWSWDLFRSGGYEVWKNDKEKEGTRVTACPVAQVPYLAGVRRSGCARRTGSLAVGAWRSGCKGSTHLWLWGAV